MAVFLFVDGYNVIGAWEELQILKVDSLAHARDKLVDVLREFAVLSEYRISVVFDGYRVKGSSGSRYACEYLEVIYTPEGITADMAIERMVAELPKHQQVYVATSDKLEQEVVWGGGALRISAGELQDIIGAAKAQQATLRQSPQISGNYLDDRIDPDVRAKLQAMITRKHKP